tara:strand:- start:59 stop:868 length:810 start_codon:yes stop_codon:yes gene_type:complete
MKLVIIDSSKNSTGEIELPSQFNEDLREDVIKRAVLVLQSNRSQPYGASPEAGKRPSVRLSKRRRDYRGTYGFGISRTPRKILSRRGRRMHWVGAFAPGTVSGRRAHPPKAEKKISKRINKKENRKAIRSAISATIAKETVKNRGHIIPDIYPFILDVNFEDLGRTKDVIAALNQLGFEKELSRVSKKTIRAGKGKLRGRKYKTKTGPLIVIADKRKKIAKAAKNIPGIDVVNVKELNAELLAPGAVPGRLTLWSKNAIEAMQKEKLFE